MKVYFQDHIAPTSPQKHLHVVPLSLLAVKFVVEGLPGWLGSSHALGHWQIGQVLPGGENWEAHTSS